MRLLVFIAFRARRLRRVCANAQSRQSLCHVKAYSMDVDEETQTKIYSFALWIRGVGIWRKLKRIYDKYQNFIDLVNLKFSI